MRDAAFTLCHPRMDVSFARLSSGAGLSWAHIPLYVFCHLEKRAVVFKYSQQMTHFGALCEWTLSFPIMG